MPKTEIRITAVWLRRIGDHAEVLVELDGKWRLAIREYADANYGHIAEGNGADNWPIDDDAEEEYASWWRTA